MHSGNDDFGKMETPQNRWHTYSFYRCYAEDAAWVEMETGSEKMNKWRRGMYGKKGMYGGSM